MNSPARRLLALVLALALGACASGPPRHRPGPPVATSPGPAAPRAAPALDSAPRPADAELLALPDAVPATEPRARFGNPAFYDVFGQRYVVLPTARGYVERGVASWYGPDFHGVRTSIGEPYDMYGMTAAHKTLPLPAYARVTNLRNGRSIIVRINDRGPFKANRIIDLSYAAALKLDVVREGTAPVEVQALEPGDVPDSPPPRQAVLYAQAGAFAVEDNALRLRDHLAAAGVGQITVHADTVGGRTLYRVRVGPIDSVAAYDALVDRLHAAGIASITLAGP